jgi:SAM-dependent methyltransferase
MALVRAHSLDGRPLPSLSGSGPHPSSELLSWRGRRFSLPPGDPALVQLSRGSRPCHPSWDNLVGAAQAWAEHPSWMDQLDPSSPVYADKHMERALYLDAWAQWLEPGTRVLDLGGGVGRFAQWLMGRECSVELVDPDLRSLMSALHRLSDGPGALDLHWTTGKMLPPLQAVDIALAVEVLCYVEDPLAVLAEIRRVLRPGGLLLLSVEAREGAQQIRDALPMDAHGVQHLPGDRWVQTYTEDGLRALLKGWEVLSLEPSHFVLSGPLDHTAAGQDLAGILELEHQARQAGRAHRAWQAVLR